MTTPKKSEGDNSVLWTIPRPDWLQWERKHKAKLWQAVALISELEPRRLESRSNPGELELFLANVPPKFISYLDQAKTAISAGLLKPLKRNAEHLEESEIHLTTFTSWANTADLPFPDGYPWRPEMSIDASGWPWGRYDTKHLRVMARAVDRFWKNYDPDDHSTLHSNEVVSSWLKSQGVSEHIAKVMATMLRADGLPTRTKKQ